MRSPSPLSFYGLQAVAPNTTQATTHDPRPTAELVVNCQVHGKIDKAAFSSLVSRYERHVHRQLYHLAPDWSDRADLAQEVWIRVYRNIRRLKEPAKFKSWLGRITTNLFYDELRKRKRFEIAVSLDAPRRLDYGQVDWDIACESPSPVENIISQEFDDCLKQAIANLPEAFRNTIILREIKGLAYEEIAENTGVSLGTVKSRIARARNRLQNELQNYLNGHP